MPDFDRLLRDATDGGPADSQRALMMALAERLNETAEPGETIGFKAVEKWFARGSIPSKWLLRIGKLTDPPLDLTRYA